MNTYDKFREEYMLRQVNYYAYQPRKVTLWRKGHGEKTYYPSIQATRRLCIAVNNLSREGKGRLLADPTGFTYYEWGETFE